ncbi:MAG: hypothetical protein M1818_000590 [Claussenomyces sp. TS43310]|nr:MAG: hypothetical protein M1818_000590 [Claussenomyces sp. TS43310]
MHGRSVRDAQPAILFNSQSSVYRTNAKRILEDAAIEFDARGVGLQFYPNGPVLMADQEMGDPVPKKFEITKGHPSKKILQHSTITSAFPGGSTVLPTTAANRNPGDAAVLVYCGTGIVGGFIMADYSLVALPGQRSAQRMWVVILDRKIVAGDCGAWVMDAENGEIYGYIVAGKAGTTAGYIVLLRDVLEDIARQAQQPAVSIPTAEEIAQASTATVLTEIQRIAEGGHLDGSEHLLKSDDSRTEGLSWAARNGHEAVVKLILESGAYIDFQDLEGRTPLSWAAQGGHEAIVKLLVDGGAHIDFQDW